MQNLIKGCPKESGEVRVASILRSEYRISATTKNNAASRPSRDAARKPSNTISLFSAGFDQAFFVYQSALIGVKWAHFSGKSSNAKMAVTGQTGTHAPQSMHSTGLM
jgi:hypothetical protein